MCPLLFLMKCLLEFCYDVHINHSTRAILLTLTFSHKSIKCLETHSPLLSDKICSGQSKRLIKFFKKWFAITDEDLVFIIGALLQQLNSSVMWKYHKLTTKWCKSMATVWLKVVALLRSTTG